MPGAGEASVGGFSSANRASAAGAPGRSPSFCPAASASAAACTRGMRRAAFSLAARRLSAASSRRDRSACIALSAASRAATLRLQRCKVRRRPLLECGHARLQAMSGRGPARRRALLQRCHPGGQRAQVRSRWRRALLEARHPGLQTAELLRQGLGRRGGRRRHAGIPPDPDQPCRQDQESGAGQPGQQCAPRRRLRRRCSGRFICRGRRLGGRFAHRSSASIASWFG